jgi:hypothetical protein
MKLNRSHSIITEAATWRTKMRWRENIWRNHEKTKTRKEEGGCLSKHYADKNRSRICEHGMNKQGFLEG